MKRIKVIEMALSDKDIAKLYTQLELPIVVNEALAEQHTLYPDEEYAFHHALSDMQPDAALLCMALCCDQICISLSEISEQSEKLMMKAENIIANYGGLWMVRMIEEKPVPEEFIIDALKKLPEDHAHLKNIMMELDEMLPHEEETISQLLEIMQIQAESNVMIAQSHLEALGIVQESERHSFIGESLANDNASATILPN